MKKIILFLFAVVFCYSINGQIFTPNGSIGNSTSPDGEVMVGPYISPGNYDSQFFINTKVNGSNSARSNLLMEYSYATPQVPIGYPIPDPDFSVMKVRMTLMRFRPHGILYSI